MESETQPNEESFPCQDCGNTFTGTVLRLLGQSFGPTRCGACFTSFNDVTATQKRNEAQADREAAWRKICPAAYRDTIPDDPRLNQAARAMAAKWHAGNAIRGIGLIAESGVGKTRCLFLALRRAHDAGRKVTAISHTKFSRVAMDAYSGGQGEKGNARFVLQSLMKADVLLLDDLGKAPSTERADSELENLVEERTSNQRPILWTANGSGKWLMERLGADRGAPTVRRLAEFCECQTIGGEDE